MMMPPLRDMESPGSLAKTLLAPAPKRNEQKKREKGRLLCGGGVEHFSRPPLHSSLVDCRGPDVSPYVPEGTAVAELA